MGLWVVSGCGPLENPGKQGPNPCSLTDAEASQPLSLSLCFPVCISGGMASAVVFKGPANTQSPSHREQPRTHLCPGISFQN